MSHLTKDTDQEPKFIKIQNCRQSFIVKMLFYNNYQAGD